MKLDNIERKYLISLLDVEISDNKYFNNECYYISRLETNKIKELKLDLLTKTTITLNNKIKNFFCDIIKFDLQHIQYLDDDIKEIENNIWELLSKIEEERTEEDIGNNVKIMLKPILNKLKTNMG